MTEPVKFRLTLITIDLTELLGLIRDVPKDLSSIPYARVDGDVSLIHAPVFCFLQQTILITNYLLLQSKILRWGNLRTKVE